MHLLTIVVFAQRNPELTTLPAPSQKQLTTHRMNILWYQNGLNYESDSLRDPGKTQEITILVPFGKHP